MDTTTSLRPRLAVASVVIATPGWLVWLVRGDRGDLVSASVVTVLLGANMALARRSSVPKRVVVRAVQKYLLNPPVRVLVHLGVLPLGFALIETTGRVSGRPRRVPVGNGLEGDVFWVVAEHGRAADYVNNLEANPQVRVRVRQGLRPVWRSGVARVLDQDDPYARQRFLSRWHPLRAYNAAIVRVLGTQLLTIRIDLDR